VGSIGLAAARRAHKVVGVEVNPSSVEWSLGNADRNAIVNYTAVQTAAERLDTAVLRGADCVIVDPPRAGLHGRVIDALLEAAPARIIYLSCNPATQVRDLQFLSGAYRAQGVEGFDFYPGTLHLESLAVLERIQ
jgi:23S rRNA (uracil1939-C5)-methyltransferase